MANEINIGINTTSNLDGINQVDQSVKSLKTQLKEAQANVAALSDTFGATSKQAVEAAKSAAMLKDKIGDAKALTDAFNPDAKFKAVSSSLVGVAGGFSAVTGAMGLFGAESKDVEKAILKVQSAMALASGVQAIGESIDSFKQLGAVIKSTTIFQRIATTAQYLWNAAMAANPIGAVVVAISALITAGYLLVKMFETSKPKIDLAAEALKKHTKETEKNNEAIKKSIEKKKQDEDYQYRLMKAQGLNEITILKTAAANAKATQAIANKNYQTAHEIALAEYLEIVERKKLAVQLENELQETKNQGSWAINVKARIEENKKELKSVQDKYKVDNNTNKLRVEDVKNANAQLLTAERNLNVGIAQEKTDSIKQEAEQKKKAAEDQKKLDDEKAAKQKELSEKQAAQKKTQLEKDKALAEKYTKDEEDLLANSETKKAILLHKRNTEEIAQMKDANAKKIALQKEYDANIIRMNAAMEADKEAEYNKSVEFMELEDGNFEVSLQKQLEHYEHLKTIQIDYGKSTIEIDKQIAATKEQIAEDNYNKAVTIIKQENNDNLDQKNNVLKHYQDLETKLKASGESTIAIQKEIAEQEKLIEKTKQEYKEFSVNKGIEVAGQAGQLLQNIAGNSKEAAIGGIVLEKAASIASIIASTFSTNMKFTGHPASILSFGTAAALPVALNTASGAIGIASIIAQASKSISEINGTKNGGNEAPKATTSKFATGGLVQGMGTSTSDSIMASLSNGESVINAKSTAMFGNLLSNINQMGGGVAFGNQSQANPIFKTYVVASEMTSQIEANLKLKQIARL
jgi:hypothetical protein